jgi:mannose-1-phosphate guanylyltransferase/phosphomannomutase
LIAFLSEGIFNEELPELSNAMVLVMEWVDGIKITFPDGTWVQILPDADDPLFHLYAEADSDAETAELLASYRERLQTVVDERLAEEG